MHRTSRQTGSKLVCCSMALALLTAACAAGDQPGRESAARGRSDGAAAVASPAAQPAPPAGFSLATVRVGPVTEAVAFQGRISDASEVAVGLPATVRIAALSVDRGDRVAEGQALAELDVEGLKSELGSVRARKEADDLRVERSRGVIEARQRRAEEEIGRLTAPPPASERIQAESSVASARENLRKAQSDLERLAAPPSFTAIKSAEQAVFAAQALVARAEDDVAKARRGPDVADIRKAANDVDAAQAAYLRALEAYRTLLDGPDRTTVRTAERSVAEAEANLRTLRQIQPLPIVVSRTGDNRTDREARERAEREAANARIQREADIKKGELALQGALDQLAKARQGPPPNEVEAARHLVESARRSLEDAQEKLASINDRRNRAEIEAADATLASARANLDRAVQLLNETMAGPSPSELAAAQSGVEAARYGVSVAQARQQELAAQRGVESEELRAARERAALFQKVGESSLDELDTTISTLDPRDRDLTDPIVLYRDALKGRTDTERQIADIESRIGSGRLLAPFGGIVTSIVTPAGETATEGRPVVLLSRGTEPMVRAEVASREATRLAAGQAATVQVDDDGGQPLNATVAEVGDGDGVRTLMLRVEWPTGSPAFGQAVQGSVVVQHKEAALLVPRRAVASAGSRRYVDVYDRTPPRRVSVDVGAVVGDEIEVTGALQEGLPVLVAP